MNRRSLSAAISVADPEIKEFLKAGVPTPKTAQKQGAEETPPPAPPQPPLAAAEAPPEKPKGRAKPVAQTEERQEPTMPVTFRLPARLVTAMIAASADRKIRRIKPSTQQDMAATAIEEWLQKNAYL